MEEAKCRDADCNGGVHNCRGEVGTEVEKGKRGGWKWNMVVVRAEAAELASTSLVGSCGGWCHT